MNSIDNFYPQADAEWDATPEAAASFCGRGCEAESVCQHAPCDLDEIADAEYAEMWAERQDYINMVRNN